MANSFGATSTTDDVLAGINLSGKRVLVTGVSAGLGVETARALVAHGAHVVGAARDLAKAERATSGIRALATNGGGFELVKLDLASLASVRACADALVADGRRFDAVIANAGVMRTPFGHTAEGFETQFGTNHLGHFVLVNRIAALMAASGRLVNVASSGHRYSDVDLDDPNFERTPYDPMIAYGRSKTANILFANEFDRRHKARGVRATVATWSLTNSTGWLRRSMPSWPPMASHPSNGRRFHKAPRPRSGQLSSPRQRMSPAAIAKIASYRRSWKDRSAPSALASELMRSILSAPRRYGPRAKRWWANASNST
jgi:NAD(P)-dependent dehydrogenase (short-subunit alcohol dehydrogenase family)